ncbi:MAG: tRNA pseudouridine(38-40) synthase TruA [Pseudomonadota bacterium]
MSRIALGVEYDGTSYVGWQRQKDGQSIQERVEAALSRVADHPVQVTCAGRTDAGVHAWGQVIHFDSDAPRSDRAWVLGANSNLPQDIAVTWAKSVGDGFHARFSALSRTYEYLILTRRARSPLTHTRAVWTYKTLDTKAMSAAAQSLVGEHDFSAFRAASCQAKSSHRNVQTLLVSRVPDGVIVRITANAFLQHMVRNIVGVLLEIGGGEQEPGWAEQVLASKDRRRGGVTAPAQGLYFVQASYPEEFNIPKSRPLDLMSIS